jgi:hypothetical protein
MNHLGRECDNGRSGGNYQKERQFFDIVAVASIFRFRALAFR